jgi:hypothetical protein
MRVNGMAPMTLDQAIAHQRMLNTLPVRTVSDADQPENWQEEGRPLSPSELSYAERALEQ